MLEVLAHQAREAPYPTEVLVPAAAEIDETMFDGVPFRRFSVEPAAHYYEVKSVGARAARGALIVFADSDVIVAEGWLDHMVRPFDDPALDAVVGRTAIRPLVTSADKAFAAATWWPAHHGEARGRIVAHCFAVRREAFLPEGFPVIGCRYRGADTDLHQAWEARSVLMGTAPAAQCEHPPPEHPIRRAMWDGHDQQIALCASGAHFLPALARVVLHQLLVGSVRTWRYRHAVDLRATEVPLSLVMNAREALTRGAGFILARFAHGLMHRVPQ